MLQIKDVFLRLSLHENVVFNWDYSMHGFSLTQVMKKQKTAHNQKFLFLL